MDTIVAHRQHISAPDGKEKVYIDPPDLRGLRRVTEVTSPSGRKFRLFGTGGTSFAFDPASLDGLVPVQRSSEATVMMLDNYTAMKNTTAEYASYEYTTLCRMHLLLPEHVPAPLALITDPYSKPIAYMMDRVNGLALLGVHPVEEAIRLFSMGGRIKAQLEKIVETMHCNGICHADLHGRNILVTPTGAVFVIDPYPYSSTFPEAVKTDRRNLSANIALIDRWPLYLVSGALRMSVDVAIGIGDPKKTTDLVKILNSIELRRQITGRYRRYLGSECASYLDSIGSTHIDAYDMSESLRRSLRSDGAESIQRHADAFNSTEFFRSMCHGPLPTSSDSQYSK